MKSLKVVIVICIVLLIILGEIMRYNTLRRMELGLSVSEYELQLSVFLQSVAFAPVGFGLGITCLFFPKQFSYRLDQLIGKVRHSYPNSQMLSLRLAGLFLISITAVVLWNAGQFLLR